MSHYFNVSNSIFFHLSREEVESTSLKAVQMSSGTIEQPIFKTTPGKERSKTKGSFKFVKFSTFETIDGGSQFVSITQFAIHAPRTTTS